MKKLLAGFSQNFGKHVLTKNAHLCLFRKMVEESDIRSQAQTLPVLWSHFYLLHVQRFNLFDNLSFLCFIECRKNNVTVVETFYDNGNIVF